MKNSDSPDLAGDEAFERELLECRLKEIPASWRSVILPAPLSAAAVAATAPWLPKPVAILLIVCWAGTAGFWLTTPREEAVSPPPRWMPLAPDEHTDSPLLTYAPPSP